MVSIARYGSWISPLSATTVAHSGIGLEQVTADGADVYWVESRPTESGRSVIVRRTPDGSVVDVSPQGFDSRTRVHEYGGGAYAVHNGAIVSSNFGDQRVYRLDADDPRPITPAPELPAGDRYADFVFHGDVLICVRERHRSDAEAVNELVAFPLDGSAPPHPIASGHDFTSSPRVSADGARLAWITWDHPNMPWDGTELWVADLATDGTLSNTERVAGGAEESVIQPEWSGDGRLHFVSDRSGWWNLYRLETEGQVTPLCPKEAEFGVPHLQFGYRRYAFLADTTIAAFVEQNGVSTLTVLDGDGHHDASIDRNVVDATLAVADGRIWTVASSATQPAAVICIEVGTSEVGVIRRSLSVELDEGYVSIPQAIDFPTTGGAVAHAFYYRPTNADFAAPADELPPLVVWSHGGPTSATSPGFNPGRQFWTSRGFALVDVNYRGSTGYGRAYRNALRGRWGVIDTDDCIAAARHLAGQGLVDGRRMAIRGGSAGGYTTLCALTFHDAFAAGTSYFGVADLGALAEETHKFESRYLDSMVGPYDEDRELYRARSPIHHTELLSKPMLILQGLDDAVVPPDQAEMMVRALDRMAIPHAYLAFEGEGHGFRRAENLVASLEAELSFYGWVFGFTPAGDIPVLEIRHA